LRKGRECTFKRGSSPEEKTERREILVTRTSVPGTVKGETHEGHKQLQGGIQRFPIKKKKIRRVLNAAGKKPRGSWRGGFGV